MLLFVTQERKWSHVVLHFGGQVDAAGIDTSSFVILLQVPVFLVGGIVPWSLWHAWWHCALVSVLPAAGLRPPLCPPRPTGPLLGIGALLSTYSTHFSLLPAIS